MAHALAASRASVPEVRAVMAFQFGSVGAVLGGCGGGRVPCRSLPLAGPAVRAVLMGQVRAGLELLQNAVVHAERLPHPSSVAFAKAVCAHYAPTFATPRPPAGMSTRLQR